ncbi:MAG: metal ABC transporter substrate-binding protein [Caldilineaceae bacterium]|nr:metal ABC transporter substrate-binding protein [Caldilineaceae bacterium]
MRNSFRTLLSLLALLLLMAACVPIATEDTAAEPAPQEETVAEPQAAPLVVVTTGNVIANHIYNIGGDRVTIERLVAQGTDPHHYEPAPSDVVKLTEADIIFLRGGNRPEAVRTRLERFASEEATIAFVDAAIESDEFIYDDFGHIDMHLGGDTIFTIRYAGQIRDTLVNRDPDNADTYNANHDAYTARLMEVDEATKALVATIPEKNRQLYSYHNSFSYFARRHGFKVLGSIQPHDFSEPSAHDVAEIIDLLRELKLPAIFGSSFTPSPVMEQISREADVPIFWIDDDTLPGEPGDLEHSFVNMKVQNMKTLAEALGGDPTLMDHIDTRNIPETE